MVHRRDVIKAAGAALAGAVAGFSKSVVAQSRREVLMERDVCVIGGGSAGTYTAVRLRDLGRSVAVIEIGSRLGGHAETYVDPASGVPIDIGVIVLENSPLAQQYLGRFGVLAVPAQFPPGDTSYADFRTGRVVDNYSPPQAGAALFAYQQILSARFPYLDDGFQLPEPVPEDLVLPFRNFVRKYGLDAMVPTVWDFGQGIGDLLDTPALYALKLFSLSVVNAILGIGGAGFLILPFGVAQLYDRAAAFLGDDVVFGAHVLRVRRDKQMIEVRLDSPAGPRIVRSRKLVVAIPPTLQHLADFDLDPIEEAAFDRLRSQCYATGVVKLAGLPAGLSIHNNAPGTEFNLPPLPGIYGLTPSPALGLWNVKYGADRPLPSAIIRRRIENDIERLARAGTLPVQFQGFQVFSNHTPFQLMASGNDIANGFYRVVKSLQGRRETFYNSAAFQTNNSSLIWRRTEGLLARIAGVGSSSGLAVRHSQQAVPGHSG